MSGILYPDIIVGNANAETIVTSFTMNTSNHLTKYVAQNNSIIVGPYLNNSFTANDKVFLWFVTNSSSNIANTNYTINRSNGEYLFITNPLSETISGNIGNVRVYKPDITIKMNYSLPQEGSNIYLQWANTLTNADITLANGFYSVYKVGSASFNVAHPNSLSAVSTSNTVNVITKKVQITSVVNHEFNTNDLAYILFLGGDTANTSNGYYVVQDVTNNSSFNIAYQKTILSGSTVRVHKKRSRIVITGTNSFANSNTIYLSFTSGDQANSTNGVYDAIKIGALSLMVNVPKSLTANSNVRIWSSQNNYSNILFRTSNANSRIFRTISNNNVYIEFYRAGADLANGVYTIKSRYGGTNTYNIFYNANTYINQTTNTVNYSGIGVSTNSVMEGISLVSMYK